MNDLWSSLVDPRKSASNVFVLSFLFLFLGVALSLDRLATVLPESSRKGIAAYRAKLCRVVGDNEKLELGAFYYQPIVGEDGQIVSGRWLSEGEYICDLFGTSGRVERGGSLQYIVNAPPEVMNEILLKRLEATDFPDSNPNFRPRRDHSIPPAPAVDEVMNGEADGGDQSMFQP